MRVLVVGAGSVGVQVLKQLQKNPALTILTADPREEPLAVREGIVEAIDVQEALTPLTLSYVIAKAEPDIILLTTASEDLGLGMAPGMDILADALKRELAAASSIPMIQVSRRAS